MNIDSIISGKAVPRDRFVNESTTDYIVRKYKELQKENFELREKLKNYEKGDAV